MDLARIKQTEAEVAVLAVGVCRTPLGNTHVGIVHRDADGRLLFLEQAFHKYTRNDAVARSVAYCDGRFVHIVPDIDPDRAELVAGLCRLISATGPAFAYALRHDPEAKFDPHTGELALPNGMGLNCSTFVLVVFKSARIPLIDFTDWPSRAEDAQAHELLIRWLEETQPPAEQAHMEAVRREIGCVRARPEEVAGACLCRLPARFEQAEPAGKVILGTLDDISRPSSSAHLPTE